MLSFSSAATFKNLSTIILRLTLSGYLSSPGLSDHVILANPICFTFQLFNWVQFVSLAMTSNTYFYQRSRSICTFSFCSGSVPETCITLCKNWHHGYLISLHSLVQFREPAQTQAIQATKSMQIIDHPFKPVLCYLTFTSIPYTLGSFTEAN